MKKFTSIILTFVLALSNMAFCVFAAGEPVEIVLLAPPAGVAAVQENVLPDGEYIADGAPEGVYVNGGNIALDGSSVGGGNFTVIDSNGDVAAAVNVVPYLYYEDFEDRTVGDSISTALLPKLSPDADDKSMFADDSTVLIAEENGNKYAEGNGIAGSVNPIVIPFADTGVNSDIVNFRAKILRKTGDGGASYPGLIVYDSVNTSSSPLIELRFIAPSGKNTRTNIWSKGLADGTRGSGNGTTIGSFGNEAWIELRVEMNFSTKKYDIYMGEDCIANDFIMYNSQTTSGKIGSIQLGVRTDDILIYSGAEADVTIEGNMPEYVTVSQDKTSMIPFDVAVEPFGTLPEFTSNTNGVSVVDGFICVAPNTSASTAELTAEAFGETKDFTVNLNAALEGDMDSGSVNISERAVFNAKVKNGGTLSLLTDNGSVDIDVSAGLEEYSNLDVYLDLNNGSYISVLDKKEDLYIVQKNGKFGIIKSGDIIVIKLEYDIIGINNEEVLMNIENRYNILDNLIPVCKDKKWGAFDKEGKEVIKVEYDGFGCNTTAIEINGISKEVKPVLEIQRCNGIVVRKLDKYGIIDTNGKELVQYAGESPKIPGAYGFYTEDGGVIIVKKSQIESMDIMEVL